MPPILHGVIREGRWPFSATGSGSLLASGGYGLSAEAQFYRYAEGAAAIVSVLGLIVTIFLLPETKGKSLEELSEEPATPLERVAA
jgi:hypothetical protein